MMLADEDLRSNQAGVAGCQVSTNGMDHGPTSATIMPIFQSAVSNLIRRC